MISPKLQQKQCQVTGKQLVLKHWGIQPEVLVSIPSLESLIDGGFDDIVITLVEKLFRYHRGVIPLHHLYKL